MKSAASNFCIFFVLTSLLFNCATNKPKPMALPTQKAFVLLHTEGSEKEINELTSVLNSNFVTNKIASDIDYYPLGRVWNNNQILTTAYNNNYDYIVLIDQVAKFTIDNKNTVGRKYQIRFYHFKSPNPDWVDLGQKTCNISVRQSIDIFSEQIIRGIVPNYEKPKDLFNQNDLDSEKRQTGISALDYNQLKSSKELDSEIAELRKRLEKEKQKTNRAIAEKARLEEEYGQILNFQKEKNETILEGLDSLKRKRELEEIKHQEEIKIEEQKKKEAQAITEAKEMERMQKEDDHLAEALRKKENTKAIKARKASKKKVKVENAMVSANKSNALIIIRGRNEDHGSLKDLQDNLESELLFANIKASTQILNKEKTFDKVKISSWNKSKYQYIILIDQLENNENGESSFSISIHSDNMNSGWKDLDKKTYDLNEPNLLKSFSKTILKSL